MYNRTELPRRRYSQDGGDQQLNDTKHGFGGDSLFTFISNTKQLEHPATFWDALSFGICVASANIFIDWSNGFVNGYWDYLFATVMSSSSFICLHLCIAEMVSVVPFAGGNYALARVTVSPYIGFLVGCFEAIGNIVFTLIAMMPIGSNITYMFGGSSSYEPFYWLVAYILVIATEFAGRKFFFGVLRCGAFISMALLVLFLIVSIQDIHINEYLPNIAGNTFRNGITDLLPILPTSGWYYYGVEIMPLLNDEINEAKKNTPRAIVTTIAVVTMFAYVCIIAAYAQYPGYADDYALDEHNLPLNSGFSNAFGINDEMATLLSYPALYISNALFIYGYGKQMRALAKSKLFPSFLSWTPENSNVPYMSLIVGSLTGYVILVILVVGCGYNYNSDAINDLYNAAIMGSYFTFMILFYSFIIFRTRYSNLTRSFVSPVGIAGACYGMVGMTFLLASVIGFSDDQYYSIMYFAVYVSTISLYYYLYARHRQIFSEEEQKILFVVYLIKANQKKQKALRSKPRPVLVKNTWASTIVEKGSIIPEKGSDRGKNVAQVISSPRNSISSHSNGSILGSLPSHSVLYSSKRWRKFQKVHVSQKDNDDEEDMNGIHSDSSELPSRRQTPRTTESDHDSLKIQLKPHRSSLSCNLLINTELPINYSDSDV